MKIVRKVDAGKKKSISFRVSESLEKRYTEVLKEAEARGLVIDPSAAIEALIKSIQNEIKKLDKKEK